MKLRIYLLLLLIPCSILAQEGIPVYADYLSDNLYLVHPSMAGAGNTNKIRLTARQQWFDIDNAPNTQSLNVNFRTGDRVGLGAIAYTDENGRFSQTGFYGTFAYHLLFSRDRTDLNMLSFGLSAGFIQSSLDLKGLDDPVDFDPVILERNQRDGYFNLDLGFSYHLLELYAHFTIKNFLPAKRDIFDNTNDGATIADSNNQRRYIFSLGYVIDVGNTTWSVEPSMLYQVTEQTQESALDANLKFYKGLNSAVLWGGLSYRTSLEGAEFTQGGSIDSQQLQYITPFFGVNWRKWMVGYTYSYQSNTVVVSDGGFHQITLGYDFAKREERWDCNCPAVNNKIN